MCGRFSQTQDPGELAPRFQARNFVPDWTPRYNIAPTQNAAVIIALAEGRVLQLMRWGLVPFWAKDETIGAKMINARSETLRQKPAFRKLFERQRCLVVADGYYEWRKSGVLKEPFRFVLNSGEPFAMAGLYDRWPLTGLETFTVITTQANELARSVHDRMPVLLEPSQYTAWLDFEYHDTAALERFLAPFPSTRMKCFPVSPRVNSARHDDPQCITPLPSQVIFPGFKE